LCRGRPEARADIEGHPKELQRVFHIHARMEWEVKRGVTV